MHNTAHRIRHAVDGIPASLARQLGWVVTAVTTLYFLYQPIRGYRDGSQFYNAFISGALVKKAGGCIYCQQQVGAALAGFLHVPFPRLAYFPFNYPPPIAVAFEPFTTLSYHAGFALFTAVSLCAVLVAGWLLYAKVLPNEWRRSDRAMITALSITTVGAGIGLRDTSLDPIMLAAAVAALPLRVSGRRFAAGLLLAVLLVKPQTIWLLPLALLVVREWRVIAGMACGGVAWLLASIVLVGRSSIADWIRSSTNSGSEASLGLPGVVGRLTGTTKYWIWVAIFCVSVALIAAWLVRDLLPGHPQRAIAIGIAASLAFSPHMWEYEMILVALCLCVWARTQIRMTVATILLMNAIFLINRAAVWEDYFVWIPPLIIATGLLRELFTNPQVRQAA